MTYLPMAPAGGLVGWAMLNRTLERQQAAMNASPVMTREVEYFRNRIPQVTNADELMADRRLLSVALGAFGLSEDLPNRYFIRRVLEDGSTASDALANRLSDKRYLAMSKAFGFGDPVGRRTNLSGFADEIVGKYQARRFEEALGETRPDLRLALAFEREMEQAAANVKSEDALWFTVMATPPLRSVVEGAFRLPPAFGAIDVDQQLRVLQERASARFGTSDARVFLDPETRETLLRQFLATSETGVTAALSSGSVALTLLSQGASAR